MGEIGDLGGVELVGWVRREGDEHVRSLRGGQAWHDLDRRLLRLENGVAVERAPGDRRRRGLDSSNEVTAEDGGRIEHVRVMSDRRGGAVATGRVAQQGS